MSMRSFTLAVLLLLGASACSANYYQDVCSFVRTKCKASASLKLSVKGSGSCSGYANSYCSAKATAQSCFNTRTAYADGKCRSVYLYEDAYCFAKAAAEAYANAYASASCYGKSAFGCANADASAEAVACAVAYSVVQLSAAIGPSHKSADCYADVSAMVQAFTSVVVDAHAKACSYGDGDYIFDSEYNWGEAVQEAIAKAYASCYVYCDGYGKDAQASVHGGASGETIEYIFGTPGAYITVGRH